MLHLHHCHYYKEKTKPFIWCEKSTEHFSLKSEERDQTIWECIVELHLCIQMELKFPDFFFKNLPDGASGCK